MKNKILLICFIIVSAMALMSGCGASTLKNGYYTAEMSEFDHGWKEYVCIQVKNDVIVSAEFNAKNESGFIKAWDNTYMSNMKEKQGTYPNEYTRKYVQQLIEQQKDIEVDVVTGASNSGTNFTKLVNAVFENAKTGNTNVVVVE